jgi:hypothetical protein
MSQIAQIFSSQVSSPRYTLFVLKSSLLPGQL